MAELKSTLITGTLRVTEDATISGILKTNQINVITSMEVNDTIYLGENSITLLNSGAGFLVGGSGQYTAYKDQVIVYDENKNFNLPVSKTAGTYTLATTDDLPPTITLNTTNKTVSDGQNTLYCANYNQNDTVQAKNIRVLTQSEYDSITTKDTNTVYLIKAN